MSVLPKSVLHRALSVLVTGEPKDDIDTVFTEDVMGWSPILSVSTLSELRREIDKRRGALANFDLQIDEFDIIGEKVIAEWHGEVDHVGPIWLGREFKFDATNRRLRIHGATFAFARDKKVAEFRNYFDDAALIEQVVLPEDEIIRW